MIFVLALVLGAMLAVGISVWATSVGTNVSVTGNLTVDSASASSSVTYALGVGTSTPAVQLSVGGAKGNATGHGYFTGGLGVGAISTTAGRIVANVSLGVASTTPAQELSVVGNGYFTSGLGVGIATTTAGAIQNIGNALFGDASTDFVMYNSALHVFNNAGTSTIPSANANAWNIATSSANIPFVKYDTSNYRIGISTTSPAVTLSVGGAGNIYALGGIGAGTATTTAGAFETTGAGLIGGAFNVGGASQFNGTATFGANGTAVNSIIHGFCLFGPIAASQSIAATSTGTVACTTEAPTGLAAGDKIWLTASTTAHTAGVVGLNYVYTGIASSTATNRIQAIILNVSGAAYTVTTSTWQYLIVK